MLSIRSVLLFILIAVCVCMPVFCEEAQVGEAAGEPVEDSHELIPGLSGLNPFNLLTKEKKEEVKDGISVEVLKTSTDDNWKIAVKRYIAVNEDGVRENTKATVILCHGFNFNNLFWDPAVGPSLARYLVKAGYDVWAVDLRGSGSSSKPALSDLRGLIKLEIGKLPEQLANAPSNLTKFNWTIDDHIHRDLPAVIDFVKRKSGNERFFWIGHSMGGIVMYGYLETEDQDDVAGFVAIGSMMKIPYPLNEGMERISSQKPLLTASLLINTTMASQMQNLSFGAVKNPLEEMLYNSDNMDEGVIRELFGHIVEDTSPGVVGQFSDSIRAGELKSLDGEYSYAANLNKVSVPVLLVGGQVDKFAAVEDLGYSYMNIASIDKELHIFSKANGYSIDYGHCDLLLGKQADKEVYPVILEWLDKRVK